MALLIAILAADLSYWYWIPMVGLLAIGAYLQRRGEGGFRDAPSPDH